jgi:hypothetical protein
MEDIDLATIGDLSDAELDMVGAGVKGLSLNLSTHLTIPTSVSINVAVPTQVANEIAVLSASIQAIYQSIGIGEA